MNALPKINALEYLSSSFPKLLRLRTQAMRDDKQKKFYEEKLEYEKQLLQERIQDYSPKYPPLPVSGLREEFKEKLSKNRVIIVQGETGSGKTTQIPKFCLEMGLSHRGWIGCTQPRRIAALSICDRLREELEDKSLVATKIRFHEDTPKGAQLKVMTDGILLQEFRKDPWLSDYTCVILDEAHERSLNIDVLLGICKRIWLKRKDFHIVVTSATIDADRFSAFFDGAPVLQAEGRAFPVKTEYWDPLDMPELQRVRDPHLVLAEQAILDLQTRTPDNLLCFLPTEKDIVDLQAILEKRMGSDFLVLPLFGRLSAAEQKRIFAPSNKHKIVLSTNIAETSVTIPGIAYVVDSGLARISRYQIGHRVQGLPIEPISQASARQRTGRAGRVKPGTCIRLYSEDDLRSREEYTDPEILRSNLANVILQFKLLKIDPEEFPLLERPSPQALRDGAKLLYELGALEGPGSADKITKHGRELAFIPIDVTLAHILQKGKHEGFAEPLAVIAALLSLQDILIRPQDDKEKARADGLHSRFKDKRSDFLAILKLWYFVQENLGRKPSNNQMRKLCTDNYFSYMRLREWIDLVVQFRNLLELKGPIPQDSISSFHYDNLHKIILSGFLSMVAQKDPEGYGYKLAGNRECALFPGSGLFKQNPKWVLSTEVRETSKTFLFRSCIIEPEWIFEVAPQFCKQHYFGQTWNPDRGFVEAQEKITFKNFVLIAARSVDFFRIEPEASANIFWEDGVASFALPKKFAFLQHNDTILKQIEEYQEKMRQSHWRPLPRQMADWYREQAPKVRTYDELKQYLHKNGDESLRFKKELWMAPKGINSWTEVHTPKVVEVKGEFPDHVIINGQKVAVEYVFDIRSDRDGITLHFNSTFFAEIELLDIWFAVPGFMKRLHTSCVRHQKDGMRPKLESQSELYEQWQERCLENSSDSVLYSWAQEVESQLSEDESYLLPKKWDAFQKLHLNITSPDGKETTISISPIWDGYQLLDWKRQYFAAFEPFPSLQCQDYFVGPDSNGQQSFYQDSWSSLYANHIRSKSKQLEILKSDGRKKSFAKMADQLRHRMGNPSLPKINAFCEIAAQLLMQEKEGLELPKADALLQSWDSVINTIGRLPTHSPKNKTLKSLDALAVSKNANSLHSIALALCYGSLALDASLWNSFFALLLREAHQELNKDEKELLLQIQANTKPDLLHNSEFCFWLSLKVAQQLKYSITGLAPQKTMQALTKENQPHLFFQTREQSISHSRKTWKALRSTWKVRLQKVGLEGVLPTTLREPLNAIEQCKDWETGQDLSLQIEIAGRIAELELLRKNESQQRVQKKKEASQLDTSSLHKLKGLFGKM